MTTLTLTRTLSHADDRCMGATGRGNALSAGSLCACCCDCLRRTQIVPGYMHTWMTPVPWPTWADCPSYISPAPLVWEGSDT